MKKLIGLLLGTLCMVSFMYATQSDGDRDLMKTKSFTVTKGGTLEVSVSGGDIIITPWDKNEVFVKVRGLDDEDFEDLKMSMSGNTVRIRNYSDWEENHSRWNWSENNRFEISVPSHFDLELKTSAGFIEVQGTLTGEVRVSTSAGDVQLGNITGRVSASTSGGDVKSGNIDGDLIMKTSGGDIKAGKVTGKAEVNTSGGNIWIDNVKKTLLAKTSGGDVYIGDVGGETTVGTSGGNIEVGRVMGSAQLNTAGGDIELASANGTVYAKTSGGNLRLLGITGSVEGKTAGGDVMVELTPSGKGKNRLTSASGEIRLYVAENVKATINARIRVQGRWKYSRDNYRIRSDFKGDGDSVDEEDRAITGIYQLNGGGEIITLETVNADIQIRKLSGKPHKKE